MNATEDDLNAEEEMVLIEIEGDVESIAAAKAEIDAIVSKVNEAVHLLVSPLITTGSIPRLTDRVATCH